jgi:hypothetical protein
MTESVVVGISAWSKLYSKPKMLGARPQCRRTLEIIQLEVKRQERSRSYRTLQFDSSMLGDKPGVGTTSPVAKLQISCELR